MKKAVEFRYAVLTTLVTLLWLVSEYLIGFQDTYISWYPLVTLAGIVVPVLCFRLAFIEKKRFSGNDFTFGKAVLTGFLLSLFTAVLSGPIMWSFIKYVNPGFLDEMIRYNVAVGKQTLEVVAMYINLQAFIMENVIFTFFSGMAVSIILAYRYRVKRELI